MIHFKVIFVGVYTMCPAHLTLLAGSLQLLFLDAIHQTL